MGKVVTKNNQYKGGIHINYKEYERDKAEKARISAEILKVRRLKAETKSAAQSLSKRMREYFGIE